MGSGAMIVLGLGIAVLGNTSSAYAQLEWRVSVKFVHDSDGKPPGTDPTCAWIDTPEEV